MGAVGVGIADVLDDREVAVVEQGFQLEGALGVEAEILVDFEDLLGGNGEPGPSLVIGVVAVRYEGVESIVAAGELDDHQHAVIVQAGGSGAFPVNAAAVLSTKPGTVAVSSVIPAA